jgi:uncharacterized protein (DUF2336 family)
MIVSHFQSWAETALPPSRADGVSALARAYLYSSLDPEQSRLAATALTTFLDDPSPLVRRALADAVASAAEAPHTIVLALAEDRPEIAAIVLGRSPVLTDAELIDAAGSVDPLAQCAIAARPYLSAPVSAALAEVGAPEALATLAGNPGADLTAAAIKRMAERHGEDAALREALIARGDLPIEVRADLVAASARALAIFATGRAWMSEARIARVSREAMEKATIAIAATADPRSGDIAALAAHLRQSGHVTVAFVFRVLLCGNRALFDATLSDLSGAAPSRVHGLTRHFESAGFAALYRRAGFPLHLLAAFRIALGALRDVEEDEGSTPALGASLSVSLIARVLSGCVALDDPALDKLVALLRRLQAEAEREGARASKAATHNQPVAAIAAPLAGEQTEEMLLSRIDFDEAVATGVYAEGSVVEGEENSTVSTPDCPASREPAALSPAVDFVALEAVLMAA